LRLGISPEDTNGLLHSGVQTERLRDKGGKKPFKIEKREDPSAGCGSLEAIVAAGNLSAKKRQPTMMPFNLPGDELDQSEKIEERGKLSKN